jgi:PHS family inorganic phosphate transporter-like MFS transporter
VWRFILGLGCGGVYPLAATLTAESSSKQVNRAKLVALTFSMQGIGYCIVPLFAWVLIFILGEQSDLTWRILLGVGALPGIILTFHRSSRRQKIKVDSSNSIFDEEESHDLRSQTIGNHKNEQPSQTSVLDAIRCEKDLFRKLVGTAGCWFIFDVLYYGNTLFQPIVLDAVFGGSETTKKTARDAAIIALLALPGYFISVVVVGYQSPRFIQIQGFLVMTILYAIIGMTFSSLSSNRPLLLLLYGASYFFSDYGPNTTTFMLPSMTFSPACRSTLNGISAASGKLGALLGATMFEPAAKNFGDDTVMMICSALSLIGMLMTLLCVRSDVGLGSSHTGAKQRQQIAVSRKHSAPSLLDF